jgi:transposase
MPQAILPMFSPGAKEITPYVGYENRDKHIYYFIGQVPVFNHHIEDVQSFRFIISQLHTSGHAKQSEIVKAFGVTPISVKRSVKLFRDKGMAGFIGKDAPRPSRVLTDAVLSEIQQLLNEGRAAPAIAKELKLKAGTINKAIRDGKLVRKKKNPHQ